MTTTVRPVRSAVVAPGSRLSAPPRRWRKVRPSPARVTPEIAFRDDAGRRRGGDNDGVSEAPPDPFEDAAAAVGRAGAAARRVLTGPDGPLILALVLGLLSIVEVTIYTDEIGQ